MLFRDRPKEIEACIAAWQNDGFVSLKHIFNAAKVLTLEGDFDTVVRNLIVAFNTSDLVMKKITAAADGGSLDARGLMQYMSDYGLRHSHYSTISGDEFRRLRTELLKDPARYISENIKRDPYPHYVPGRTIGYNSEWVINEISESSRKLQDFSDSRRSDTAILVGNGPSLSHVNFDLFEGQDVFISNYAIKNPKLNQFAKGVAVTNYLVAEQEPYYFQMGQHWRFFPIWLSNTFSSSEQNVFLNAVGGNLDFSVNVNEKIFWHSTVSFFWLQILYHAGYKKILMTGFDNSYNQAASAKEGDLIRQKEDDNNHFDKTYFKGKVWQAADTRKMEETYVLSKEIYEANGREIVNCTVGGKLELFRRARLADELPARKIYSPRPGSVRKPKIAVVTSFWEGDAGSTELHWRLLNRLGYRNAENHIHLFKNDRSTLPLNTLPRVVCADVQKNYPEASQKPHPAGPNLVFAHTVRMLRETGYTHFFWMEPDCVPTEKDWLQPFLDRLAQYPNEPIHGTGGGTVSPGKPHWKNHFAGCSLYSVEALSRIDWKEYLSSELDISFDVWLSVKLKYIQLLDVNNDDQSNTIIFGKNRYNWKLLKAPKATVFGMFEHWRPEKFLSKEQLEERLDWPSFKLYHAIKSQDLLKKIYRSKTPSVSTIIINYNNEKYLKAAISSALEQNAKDVDYEVIVVDDGSTDGSIDIINEFGSRVRAVLLEHGALNSNFNQQRGLRMGIEASRGDIILLLDGDDVFAPTKVAAACKMFSEMDTVIGQHILQLIDSEGTAIGACQNFPSANITPKTYADHGRVNFFQPTSGLAFRRCYLLSLKWLMRPDEHDTTWMDVRITRLSPYFGKTYNSRTIQGAWRRHAASDSIRTDDVAERVQRHERWFADIAQQSRVEPVPFAWLAPSMPSNEEMIGFLMRTAAQFLLAPELAVKAIENDEELGRRINRALQALPKENPSVVHLNRILEFITSYNTVHS